MITVKIHDYRRVVQAKMYIDQNFRENHVLADFAGEACYSKFHFLRLFKHVYRVSPGQYLNRLRVNKAKEELAGGASVAEACFASGFSSVTTFSGLFKRTVGLTPKTYRSRVLTRNNAIKEMPLAYVPACFAVKKGWL